MKSARKLNLTKGTRSTKGKKRRPYLRALEKRRQPPPQAQLEPPISHNDNADPFETAPVCLVTLTQTGVIRELNSFATRLLNPEKSHFIGLPFKSFIDRRDHSAFAMHLSRCHGNSDATQPMSVELKLARQPDKRPILIELVSMPTSSGRTHFKSVFRDITDIKAMQEAHRRLETMVESSADAMIGKNMDGLIISCNPGAERMFGYKHTELIGRPMTLLIPKGLQHEEVQILRRLRRREKTEQHATVWQRKDGTHVPVSLTVSAICDDQGEIIGISNIARDLSVRNGGRRKLERVLMQRAGPTRAKAAFLKDLTHESLQKIIEELETRNDELHSAKEEILSCNEQLQNSNEELETAKVELESTNEELTTLNDELEGRNSELERVNSDLLNLLASVNAPVLILDADHKVRRCNAMAEKRFRLGPGDIGKPVTEIAFSSDVSVLDGHLTEVFKSRIHRDIEMRDKQGYWWSVRIQPCKTIGEKIDGVVIALSDIDAIKTRAESVKD